MKVVVAEVGKQPEVREIGKELKDMQALVGGYIEMVPFPVPGTLVVCDEEGALKQKPRGSWGFMGDIFVVGSARPELRSLTDYEVEKVLQVPVTQSVGGW